jgi:hypothetical protein
MRVIGVQQLLLFLACVFFATKKFYPVAACGPQAFNLLENDLSFRINGLLLLNLQNEICKKIHF